MSGDLYQIETRRRSRSKTPFLRSSCDHENCEHAGEEGHVHQHQKKSSAAPNVHTIIEERVEVSSSSAKIPIKSQEKIFVDLTVDEDLKKRAQKSNAKQSTVTQLNSGGSGSEKTTTTTMTTTTIVTKSKKSGPSTSTPKQRDSAYTAAFESQLRYKDTAQNVVNAAQEQKNQKHTTATASASHKPANRTLYSSFDGSNGDLSDHIAYQEYKRVGEYWNATPKTDYTYSELSPHRRELAPGIVAMPNMSRRSIENHDERVNFMVARNPGNEDYIRRRYESKYTNQRRTTGADKLHYESGDEVDIVQRRRADYASKESSWYARFITTIVTTVTSVWSSITGGAADRHEAYYRQTLYSGQQTKRGFFGSIAHGISESLLSVCRYIYMFISSVLCLDTILLKSSNAENKSKKRFLLILLILLPLLLLAGTYYYLHPNESFPPKSFSEYTFTLPELPKIDMDQYINQEQYDILKAQTFERLEYVRDWADDYVLYLKTISQNVLDQGRKLFQRETHYERV